MNKNVFQMAITSAMKTKVAGAIDSLLNDQNYAREDIASDLTQVVVQLHEEEAVLLEQLKKPAPTTFNENVPALSKQAVIGYALLAAVKAGVESEQLHQLVHELHGVFEKTSIKEAAQCYRSSNY
ncbi:hypothetical protein ABE504_25200 [Paenibacillus oryzisoli]|uniref:hypothetical protein n=1 Tax=Paenibacillus oryzisoli TaxID=1850517 RepID=UPI003D29629B